MTIISSSTLLPGGTAQTAASAATQSQRQAEQKEQDKTNAYGPPYVVDISQLGQALLKQDGASANLTDAQRQTIQSVFNAYKDAPLTDDRRILGSSRPPLGVVEIKAERAC